MRKLFLTGVFIVSFTALSTTAAYAQASLNPMSETPAASVASESATPSIFPTAVPRTDITQKTEEALGPLEKILNDQKVGSFWKNPIKYAIRGAVSVGVPANTIVLLLLLPLVAAIIAAARHVVGLRGFGIFLPAALSVVFLATGPVVGIGLFLVIVAVSTSVRMILRKTKIKLQYLPRMAMLLLFVVFGVLLVLFMAPILKHSDLTNVSIFPVLILVLLSEDFTRVQIGKSANTAINLTTETLLLALISFAVLTYTPVQEFALLHPEILLLTVLVFDFLIGKYVGLRFVEYWRFRKLITKLK